MTHPAYVLILVTVLLAPEQLPTAQGAPGGNGVSPAARTSRLHSVSLRSAALRGVDAHPVRQRGDSFGRQGTTVTTTGSNPQVQDEQNRGRGAHWIWDRCGAGDHGRPRNVPGRDRLALRPSRRGNRSCDWNRRCARVAIAGARQLLRQRAGSRERESCKKLLEHDA